jgi:hypothetical protein
LPYPAPSSADPVRKPVLKPMLGVDRQKNFPYRALNMIKALKAIVCGLFGRQPKGFVKVFWR